MKLFTSVRRGFYAFYFICYFLGFFGSAFKSYIFSFIRVYIALYFAINSLCYFLRATYYFTSGFYLGSPSGSLEIVKGFFLSWDSVNKIIKVSNQFFSCYNRLTEPSSGTSSALSAISRGKSFRY